MLVAPKPKPEKVIDDDGFELVQKGRRKRWDAFRWRSVAQAP
jgi:hypothetical protein